MSTNFTYKAYIDGLRAGAIYSSLLQLPVPFNNWSIIAKAGCNPGIVTCLNFFSSLLGHIAKEKYQFILFSFSSRLIYETTLQSAERNEDALIKLVKVASVYSEVLFHESPPGITDNPQLCSDRPFSFRINRASHCYLSRKNFQIKYDRYFTFLSGLDHLPNVHLVRTSQHFCNESVCEVIKDGKSLYSNGDHISDYSGKILANDLVVYLR